MGMTVTPMRAALGAVVEGFNATTDLSADVVTELTDAWHRHQVLFFPQVHWSPADQVRVAGLFGPRLAAITETGENDYRNPSTLAAEGFPQILVLESSPTSKAATNTWHTDVTFIPEPPIGSLFYMEIAAPSGGDTMWSSQRAAYAALSESIKQLIAPLTAIHGQPPLTGVHEHAVVKHHDGNGEPHLFVSRGWTRTLRGLSQIENRNILNLLIEHSERPEFQIRWQWQSGDGALWDNRCTMHYAINDYGDERRRARRVTIYQD